MTHADLAERDRTVLASLDKFEPFGTSAETLRMVLLQNGVQLAPGEVRDSLARLARTGAVERVVLQLNGIRGWRKAR